MACDDRPVCIFAFYLRIRRGEVFILCPGLNLQLVSMVTANWHFLCCHVFPVVSELDCLLLEHVVFLDDSDFCLWEMLRQGGS